MCGRYAASRDASELGDWYRVEELPSTELAPRFNVAPTSEVYIVVDEDNKRRLTVARWGLIPSWSSDASRASRMINARSESVATKPSFRAAFRRRRCVVPADGYYEWRPAPDGAASRKQPFYIYPHSGGPLAMAGLFEDWHGPHGEMRTCTIMTQEAAGPVADIHDRMPVEVPESWWERWLDPDLEDAQGALEDICAQSRTGVEAGSRDFHPVSTRVNAPVNEGADLITPV
ncbi:MAG: SOS response-associated peptidase [Actinomycetota bacterium]